MSKKAVVRRAPPKPAAKPFMVVHVHTVSRHATQAEAKAALKGVKLKGDDISFVMKEGEQ